jgi:hypothetical protein
MGKNHDRYALWVTVVSHLVEGYAKILLCGLDVSWFKAMQKL